MAEPDASLWNAWCRERDASAFKALVAPALPHALGFARRMGCNAHDAEDALQEALVELASVRDVEPMAVGVRAWLCRAVRTRARSRLRSERRRRTRQAGAAVREARDPAVSRAALREDVEAALADLGADQREAVSLRYLHDLDYRDIALVLGISEAACRQRVHRGIERLRDRLGRAAPALLAVLPLPAVPAAEGFVGAALATAARGGVSGASSLVTGGVLMASAASKALWVGAVVAALGVGALVWRGAFVSSSASDPDRAATTLLVADPTSGSDPRSDPLGSPPGARTGPTLAAGRGLSRVGKGAVLGRVRDARTTQAVAHAVVSLYGPDLAGRDVTARAETGADGSLELADVAAGLDYTLRIEATGLAPFEQRGVVVRADTTLDLGDLWLGLPGILEGRVLDVAGTGVVGAEVALYRRIDSLGDYLQTGGVTELFASLGREPEPLARASTASGGAYRLACPQAGPATVVVRAPGYQQAILHVTLASGDDAAPLTITLAPGSTLAGRVTDPAGNPVAGARLTALAADGRLPSPFSRAFTDSAADGTFRFTSLAGHGRFAVVGSAPGHPDAFVHANAGDRDVRVVLRRGATLQVYVVDDGTNAPVVGAQVLVAVGDTHVLDDGPGSLTGRLTDTSGVATFDVFPGALQMAIVTAPGFPPNYWDAAGRSATTAHGLKGPADPRVGAGLTTVTFRLPVGVRLRGRVLSSDGTPLAGAEVTSPGFLGQGAKVLSAADGSYELDVLASDVSLGVTARLAGWVHDRFRRVPDASDALADAMPRTLDLHMRRAVTLAGRVIDADGHPVAGATVVARGDEAERGFAFEPLTQQLVRLPAHDASSLTRKDGTYAIEGVAPGAGVRVLAHHPAYLPAVSEALAVFAPLEHAPDVLLTVGALLDVRVTDASGIGVADARVRVELDAGEEGGVEDLTSRFGGPGGAGGWDDRLTDSNGATQFRLPAGTRVVLRVEAKGFGPTGTRRTLPAGSTRPDPVTIRLARGLDVSGRVVDEAGRPLAGAQVVVFAAQPPDAATGAEPDEGSPGAPPTPAELWSNDWDRSRRATTDALGRWRVLDLPHARFAAAAAKDGYGDDRVPIDPSGAAPDLRLTALSVETLERIAAIDKELQTLYGRMSLEGETSALVERVVSLQQERQRLRAAPR